MPQDRSGAIFGRGIRTSKHERNSMRSSRSTLLRPRTGALRVVVHATHLAVVGQPEPDTGVFDESASRDRVSVGRASVLECVRPSGAVAQGADCQPASEWIFPERGDWRTSHGSRRHAARANEPWLLGLASGDVFQSGGGPPHSPTLARLPWAVQSRSVLECSSPLDL